MTSREPTAKRGSAAQDKSAAPGGNRTASAAFARFGFALSCLGNLPLLARPCQRKITWQVYFLFLTTILHHATIPPQPPRRNTMVSLVPRCPQCPELKQGTSIRRDRLEQMLETGEEITVIGSQCGHAWALSDKENQNLREAIASGCIWNH